MIADGDVQNPGIEGNIGDWQKVSVEVKSNDSFIYVLIGLLEGANNKHVFNGSDKFEVSVSGIEVSPL